jgi:hypothetical protein
MRDPFADQTLEDSAPVGCTAEHGFRASEAIIIPRGFCDAAEGGIPGKPITILFRCREDGHHTIRQYDLLPKSTEASEEKELNEFLASFPFHFPSICTRVIPVTPSCSQLRFSSSGKGIWLETRNVSFGIANDTRAARCIIGADVSRDDEEEENQQECGNRLNISKGEVYSRYCGMQEVMMRRYKVNSVDLEDSVGRIVIGDRDGNVEVLEYA